MPAQLWKSHSGRTFCFLIQISVHQAQYDAKSCRETFQVYPLGTGVGTSTFPYPMQQFFSPESLPVSLCPVYQVRL